MAKLYQLLYLILMHVNGLSCTDYSIWVCVCVCVQKSLSSNNPIIMKCTQNTEKSIKDKGKTIASQPASQPGQKRNTERCILVASLCNVKIAMEERRYWTVRFFRFSLAFLWLCLGYFSSSYLLCIRTERIQSKCSAYVLFYFSSSMCSSKRCDSVWSHWSSIKRE